MFSRVQNDTGVLREPEYRGGVDCAGKFDGYGASGGIVRLVP